MIHEIETNKTYSASPAQRRWISAFLEPAPVITASDERRQSRLIIQISLVMLLALIAKTFLDLASNSPPASLIAAIFYSLTLFICFLLARTRFRLAGGILTISATLVLLGLVEIYRVNNPLGLSVVTGGMLGVPLIGYLVGSTRMGNIGFAAVWMAIAVSLFNVRDGAITNVIIRSLMSSLILFAALVVYVNHLKHLEEDRQLTLRTLTVELQAALVDAQASNKIAHEASRLKSEFLATMSHELRTPLNAIIGFSEIMMSGMAGQIDNEAHNMTERIHANSHRLLALINDVLDLSKIEAMRVAVLPHPFSPREMVHNLASQMHVLAERKGLKFEYILDPTLPTAILGDQNLIERVATNLLSNAFKFTEKGNVKLVVERASANQWSITVIDTGIGIPTHAREFIFDPFRQVDGSSQRAYGGSGLGLAIVRELIRAMDGNIALESTVGQGSHFTVTLPLILPLSE